MDKAQLTGKDLLLALLYCPNLVGELNEPITGRTRLTKMIYLFEKEIWEHFFKNVIVELPPFEPCHFGPFSKKLFDDLKFFLSIGFIESEETLIPLSSADRYEVAMSADDDLDGNEFAVDFEEAGGEDFELRYFLSEKGKRYVSENIWGSFTPEQQKNLINFKQKINTISLDSLLNYVYNKYPEDAAKSLRAAKYLKKGAK
jgi:hypothetical protein